MTFQLSFLPTKTLREAALEYFPPDRDLPPQERPVNRLHHVGTGALSTIELLAILLGTSHAIHDANRILADFDGLFGLSRATPYEIKQRDGVGHATAARIFAALELGRRVMLVTPEDHLIIRSPTDVSQMLMSEMSHLEQEHFVVLFLDTRNKVLGKETLYIGSLNASHIRVSEVFRDAVKRNCAAVIVAHNHPSGDPTPSPEDVEVTRQLVEAGDLLDIEVLDHLVIGQQRFVSLRERGLGFS
ncbi:MAG: DNA repair protein RadC [Anaerolineae bacterium]